MRLRHRHYAGAMQLDVSIIKGGQVIETERLTNPADGDVAASINRQMARARKRFGSKLWPVQWDIREV